MEKYKYKINGTVYQVEIIEIKGNMASVDVNGKKYEVEIQQEEKPVVVKPVKAAIPDIEPVQSSAVPSAEGPKAEIKAPLPGVIIKVLVKPGDVVAADQSVCTLETMKMENAIKSEKSGVITSVKISSGQSVQQDEVLIEMAVKE